MAFTLLAAGALFACLIAPAPAQQNSASEIRAASQPQAAPLTDCDTYAASDLDPQRIANGIPFEKINSVLAIPACESAVQKYPNSIRLIYQLARAYAKNNNFRSAFIRYQNAADQGYFLAEYNLGVLYEKGWGVGKDEGQAVAWYRRAAEQGFVLAQFNLGNMLRNGQGVRRDYVEALQWLHKAADQGNADALVTLGVMYAGGQGVPQDYLEAVKLFRRAAEHGNPHAQTSLGSMYGLGQGVPQDYAEAAKWFRLAADKGFANAQYLLGLLYEHGNGVPKNLAEAADWYRKAAAQGDGEAKSKLAAIDVDAKAGRGAEEAGNAALRKALAAGKTTDRAWEGAALAAGKAARDAELAGGRTEEEAWRAAQQAEDQVRAQASRGPPQPTTLPHPAPAQPSAPASAPVAQVSPPPSPRPADQPDTATSRLAHSIGVSTRELSTWHGIMRQVGGTAEHANSFFTSLADSLADIRLGLAMPSGPFAFVMGQMGMDIRRSTPDQIAQALPGFVERQRATGMQDVDIRGLLRQIPGVNGAVIDALMQRNSKAAFDEMRRRQR
jgi:TPR repeat protein